MELRRSAPHARTSTEEQAQRRDETRSIGQIK